MTAGLFTAGLAAPLAPATARVALLSAWPTVALVAAGWKDSTGVRLPPATCLSLATFVVAVAGLLASPAWEVDGGVEAAWGWSAARVTGGR